jgi:hypothetical protein
MELLITVIVAICIFALVWWLVTILPLPTNFPPQIRTFLYAILIIVAIVWLWQTFLQ